MPRPFAESGRSYGPVAEVLPVAVSADRTGRASSRRGARNGLPDAFLLLGGLAISVARAVQHARESDVRKRCLRSASSLRSLARGLRAASGGKSWSQYSRSPGVP